MTSSVRFSKNIALSFIIFSIGVAATSFAKGTVEKAPEKEQATTELTIVDCARNALKAGLGLSKFEVAQLCKGATKIEDSLSCVKEALHDEDLGLTKMWAVQLCGRGGSTDRVRCFRDSMNEGVGMSRQEALELCSP